jgi:hypothetical protein
MQPPLSKSVQCQAYNGNITPFKQGLSPSLTPTVDKGVISIHFLPVKQEHLVQRPVSSSSRRCYRSSPLHPNPAACLLSVGKETDFNHKTHQHPSGQEVKDLLTHGESLDMSPIMVGSVEIGPKHKGFCLRTLIFGKHKLDDRLSFSRVLLFEKSKILSIYQNVPIDYPTSPSAQPPEVGTHIVHLCRSDQV